MWLTAFCLQEMLGYASLPTTVVITAPRMSGIISTGSHVCALKLPSLLADLSMTCRVALCPCFDMEMAQPICPKHTCSKMSMPAC